MSRDETTSEPATTSSSRGVPEDIFGDIVRYVLASRAPDERTDGPSEMSTVVIGGPDSTRLDVIGVDSLLIAEIIVELEERLNTLLELDHGTRLQTFADLLAALRPTSPS